MTGTAVSWYQQWPRGGRRRLNVHKAALGHTSRGSVHLSVTPARMTSTAVFWYQQWPRKSTATQLEIDEAKEDRQSAYGLCSSNLYRGAVGSSEGDRGRGYIF